MILTRKQIDQLWEKAEAAPDQHDPHEYRKDFAGAWVRRDMYGYQSPFGWVVSRIKPKAAGGTDDIDNLMVCHWRNKRMKGASYPEFKSIVTSEGKHNTTQLRTWRVG